MFNPFHPLLIPPQPCIPTFFGKYTNTPSVDQSTSLSALTNNDLQIGAGTADNTGSNVNFAAANMKHVNGLAVVSLNGKTVPQTYYYDGNTGKASSVRAASTTTATVWPSVNFSSSTKPYSSSNTSSLKRYLAIIKPSTATTISTTATSGCEAWSLSYNVNQNTSSSQSVTSSRPGYYLGWVYSYTGTAQTLNAQETGKYKVECWGASGGSAAYDNYSAGFTTPVSGGAGGYCSGEINLKAIPYYIYVGHAGSSYHTETEFNGGGGAGSIGNYFCSSGGGATDFRLTYSSEWSNFESLKSRIMVAAGGGGAQHYLEGIEGGYGGGLSGDSGHYTTADFFKSSDILPTGGTQTAGGAGSKTNESIGISGGFGYGGAGLLSINHGGGGGGGYYGGGGGNERSGLVFSGAGGSSFISGHSGCNAISQASTSSKIVHTGQANHYSGYVFTNTVMKAGNETMPSPSGGRETGHSGNGYAIITQVSY